VNSLTLNTRFVAEYLTNFVFEETGMQSLFPEVKRTVVENPDSFGFRIPFYLNEFWTAKQRQASSIHEISYRACFKAQLPRFFINLLTKPGELVYDPFSGRGTTIIEAALMGRNVIANDINPLSSILSKPRLAIPEPAVIKKRLEEIPFGEELHAELDLSMFYHPDTEAEIISLKEYLQQRKSEGMEDDPDRWLRMVATNRLTGHSSGFFSVYTMPPNQAVSAASQVKINRKRDQSPPYRNTRRIIARKTASLLRKIDPAAVVNLNQAASSAIFLQNDADQTPEIKGNSVNLTVTSPPFLDIVQYSKDNWLRCWFNGINSEEIAKKITTARSVDAWSEKMGRVFNELYRITVSGGWVAFEVGEVRSGKIRLEELVIPLGLGAGFKCQGVVINSQVFTKTANIWGIDNNSLGTNTNRIVLFNK
jgi:hypothetical protein